jgi:histidinol-phosphatase (PHP family)
MYPANYHTHSYLDDGQGPLEAYAEQAVRLGFTALGFSGHAPLERQSDDWRMTMDALPVYFAEIRRLKERYLGRLEIYSGLEVDYLDDTGEMAGSEYADELDYTIASLHGMLHEPSGLYLTVDSSRDEFGTLLRDNFSNDITAMVSRYYELQKRMIREHEFDILGHCDLIKKMNAGNFYFNQQDTWYQRITDDFLETAARYGTRIEVNTGAMARGVTTEVYPNGQMLRRCGEWDIPLVISADAHKPENLDFYYSEAFAEVRAAGCRNLEILLGGRWGRLTD